MRRETSFNGHPGSLACFLYGFLALATVLLTTAAYGQCRSEAGKTVSILTPPQLAVQLSGLDLKKGEFETTQEFEKRRIAASSSAPAGVILVSTSVDPAHIRYDADRERFVIVRYAWANVSLPLDRVIGLQTAMEALSTGYHGLGLHSAEQQMGTYRASNAFGRAVDVAKIERTTYGLFDRLARPSETTWQFDFEKGSDATASNSGAGIHMKMPRGRASALKADIRFAVEFLPRAPYIVQGSERLAPRIDRPTDIAETITVFTGRIGCLVVTDAGGTVLRVVPSGY